jgi:hypothetical protein
VALLIRSISTSDSTVPHTGVTGFGDGVVTIPSAAMGVPEAEQLERLAAKGPLRIKLKLASTVDANDVAWNISGEIKGSEKPDEVIVIGGHLDSWDVGTGALDDATGIGHHHGRRQADRRPAQASQAHHPRRDVRLGRERRLVGSLSGGPQGRGRQDRPGRRKRQRRRPSIALKLPAGAQGSADRRPRPACWPR